MTTNWSGTYDFRAPRRERPGSIAQLQELVAGSPAVKVVGSAHSFNSIADSESGCQLDLSALIADPVFDPESGSVTVSGAMTYGALVPHLRAARRALPNLASLPHITVAGSVATGTHGSGTRQPGLAASVEAVELLTAEGRLRWIDRSDPDFDGMVVSLGALGVVTRLRLATVPDFQVRQDAFTGMGWGELVAELDDVLAAAYSVSVFGRWIGEGPDHVVLKSRVTPASTQPMLPGAVRMPGTLHPMHATGTTPEAVTVQGGEPGSWADRLPHFRLGFTPSAGAEIQSEFFVSRADAADGVEVLLAVGDQLAPHLFITEIRAVAADSQWLSPAYDRDSVAFHFTWKPDAVAVQHATAVVERALEPLSPRPHWGKVFTYPGRLDFAYPRLDDFDELRCTLDPRGVFRNNFVASHVARD
ncbi:D-arabinono-1,4-lactone oxidase [Flexivirga caeni]|uniref:FAD-binding protein n=1 Tax=Flexivirga caeni TaxID=2294115 RepID=A0A3M9MH84_9MICO|nr:D-arabinono-1,4-lactone oxidase [Flexivirga caeni]RNI24876.1 FAD-binding protein [Flexivirga caeni]